MHKLLDALPRKVREGGQIVKVRVLVASPCRTGRGDQATLPSAH